MQDFKGIDGNPEASSNTNPLLARIKQSVADQTGQKVESKPDNRQESSDTKDKDQPDDRYRNLQSEVDRAQMTLAQITASFGGPENLARLQQKITQAGGINRVLDPPKPPPEMPAIPEDLSDKDSMREYQENMTKYQQETISSRVAETVTNTLQNHEKKQSAERVLSNAKSQFAEQEDYEKFVQFLQNGELGLDDAIYAFKARNGIDNSRPQMRDDANITNFKGSLENSQGTKDNPFDGHNLIKGLAKQTKFQGMGAK